MKIKLIFFAVLASLCAIVISSCGKPQLKIYNWTYYTPDTVIKKFEKEFKVKVVYDQYSSPEEMYDNLKAGNTGYDVVFPSGDFIPLLLRENLLGKIDKSLIPNLKNIDPNILKKAVYDPEMEYSVPYYYGAAGIIVNTAKVRDYEMSWSIFSRKDLRNRMVMLDDMREVIGGALKYLGYSVSTTNSSQVTAARNLINNSWKPNLVKFDADNFGKGYANGDFWVVHGYAEVIFEEIANNPQLIKDTVFFIPKEGGQAYIDNMCIVIDAKNVELAHKFINFIHRPEIYAEFTDSFGFPATVNVPARQYKTGESLYTVEQLENTELPEDLGQALMYYSYAWYNSIKVGKYR